MIFNLEKSINQKIDLDFGYVELEIKREDRIHDFISGNKYRKLKCNLIEAEKKGYNTLLTFGGAHSNHIAAVAAAGKLFGFKTIGIIRGEELQSQSAKNVTLSFAENHGMRLEFVSRSQYREKTDFNFLEKLTRKFGDFYLIPEGGTNNLAVKGCTEILTEADKTFNYVCCSVGTGGTISGLINCSQPSQQVLGFPALKGDFLKEDISKFALQSNWKLINEYHFGGYAKIDPSLVHFINAFKSKYNIPLDPIYTGKMMFGLFDLIKNNYFPKGSKILAIHTGGLQGIEGMNALLEKKNLPIII